MTNDKQIEVWRKEFESQFQTDSTLGFKTIGKEYCSHSVEAGWQGFLLAKRSQPSVVLPKITQRHSANYIDGIQDCKACLTAAGIKYTIGE
jgi:hypothetical protein